jgi:hypothetical protein
VLLVYTLYNSLQHSLSNFRLQQALPGNGSQNCRFQCFPVHSPTGYILSHGSSTNRVAKFYFQTLGLTHCIHSFMHTSIHPLLFKGDVSSSQSQVRVILQPTVSLQICLGVRQPSGTRDQFVFFFIFFDMLILYGVFSLMRERANSLHSLGSWYIAWRWSQQRKRHLLVSAM